MGGMNTIFLTGQVMPQKLCQLSTCPILFCLFWHHLDSQLLS